MSDTARPGVVTTVPDPTTLVTALVDREIANLKAYFEAIVRTHTEIDRVNFEAVNTRLRSEVAATRDLADLQFVLIERQRVESKNDTEKALAAALSAQEKAAGVLATFTADQLKALGASFNSTFEAFRKDIGELKEVNREQGGERAGSTATRGAIYATAAFIAALLGIGGFVFGSAHTGSSAPVVVNVVTPTTTTAP